MYNSFDPVFAALLQPDPRVVAQTPADVVYGENGLHLLHYRPVVPRSLPVPVLIIPSLLTRYYVLDLLPGHSFVEYLVRRGLDVYLLDWGADHHIHRMTSFDTYITGYMRRCVQQVRKRSGQEWISLLGYSQGGTFAAIFAALYGHYLRNLLPISAPINFHDDGLLFQWLRKEHFNVDLVVDTLGGLPLALMQASFRLLQPTLQIAQRIALARLCGEPAIVQDFVAMQSWMTNGSPWIGEAYRTYVKDCYQQNRLIQGKLLVGGRRVDLTEIKCALLTVTAAKDQLCMPQSAAILNDLVQSTDKRVLELPGGHVGVMAAPDVATTTWPQLADWLITRSS